MRLTRAAAAAAMPAETNTTHDPSSGVHETSDSAMAHSPALPSADLSLVDDVFKTSTASKNKKGSKRGKKQVDLSSSQLHVDDPTDGVDTNDNSQISFASSTNSRRVPSGGKTPVLVAVDENAEPARPGSPSADFNKSALKPKSQVKQLLAKVKSGMRSSSNKENVQPGSPAASVASARMQLAMESPRRDTSEVVTSQAAEVQGAEPRSEGVGQRAGTQDFIDTKTGTTDLSPEVSSPTRSIPPPDSRLEAAASETESLNVQQQAEADKATNPVLTNQRDEKKSAAIAKVTKAENKEVKTARKVSASSSGQTSKDEPAKKATFKARPVPKSTNAPMQVRQTKASQAREGLKNAGSAGLKRASTVRAPTQPRQSLATSERRASAAFGAARPAAAGDVVKRARPQSTIMTGRPPMSTSTAPAATKRASVQLNGPPKTEKGKEVFKRAATGQAELEKQRREKEAAAKKARAEAAERGRLLSRQWAEKQKQKQLAAKAGGVVVGGGAKQDGGL